MKALLLSKPAHLEMTDMPIPAPGPNDVLVRVAACGICGSDVHGYDGSTGRRIPPIVMGHEAAGVVAQLGSAVVGFSLGDRVTFDSTIYCGECAYCRRGEVNLCGSREVVGVSCGDYRRHGAFAEFVVVPARVLSRLSASMSFSEAAMLEAVAVALHAVSLAPEARGSSAIVVGAGMIGLLVLQSLRTAGASRVLVMDLDSSRLKLAEELGATATARSTDSDLREGIADFCGSDGADVVMEAVGTNETVNLAIDSVRKGGTVILVGNVAPSVTIPLQKVVTHQIRLQGSCASAGEYAKAIELVSSGAIRVKPLISAVAPLDQGPEWFARLHAREPNLMKVVLTPGETS